jgi:hypothetical protein
VIDRFWRKAEQIDENVHLGMAAPPSENGGRHHHEPTPI